MPGFFITNEGKTFSLKNRYAKKSGMVLGTIVYESVKVERMVLDKFIDDKVFYEDESCIIVFDGICLLRNKILEQQRKESFIEAIKYIWNEKRSIDSCAVPCWSGAYYDKDKMIWQVCTNQIGDKPIFYYFFNGKYVVSSSLYWISDYMSALSIKKEICRESVLDLLSYGYNVSGNGSNSILNNVKRLGPGESLYIENGKEYQIKKYWQLKKNMLRVPNSESELIDELDDKFRKSVQIGFDKNKEYGYEHLCALSGGLDSRMTVWVANDLGYKDIITETFCQNDTLDVKIAKRIASDLGLPWMFKSLDDALFIKDIKKISLDSEALVEVSGSIHENSIVSKINMRTFGVHFTGQLGDVVLGTYFENDNMDCFSKANSKILFKEYRPSIMEYEDLEQFYFYTRGFNLTLLAQYFESNYCEYYSPFVNPDFLQFAFSIPIELRRNHKIYKKWILKKYPKAANYIWEGSGVSIAAPRWIEFLERCKRLGIYNLFLVMLKKLKILGDPKLKESKYNMNPYDYWYHSKEWLRSFLDSEYDSFIKTDFIEDDIKRYVTKVYCNGNCREKVQALSVAESVRACIRGYIQ